MKATYIHDDPDLALFSHKLTAARKAGRKLQQILWDGDLNSRADSLEFVLAYALFVRAERTFASIQALAKLRLFDDAYALVRVMTEKAINAEFIQLKGTDAAIDYVEYHSYREWLDVKAFIKADSRVADFWTDDRKAAMRKVHNETKTVTLPDGSHRNRYGRGNDWVEIGLLRRAQFVDEMISAKFPSHIFLSAQTLYHLTYPKSSAYLHGTWESLARSIVLGEAIPDGDGYVCTTVDVCLKDQQLDVAIEALSTSTVAALEIILFAAKSFGRQKDSYWARRFVDAYRAKEKL